MLRCYPKPILGDWREAPTDPLSRVDFHRKAEPEFTRAPTAISVKYKARALDGIWATAPYLHNGSVPNLYELLLPPARRSTSFSIGVKTFDPNRVGYLEESPRARRVAPRAGRSRPSHCA